MKPMKRFLEALPLLVLLIKPVAGEDTAKKKVHSEIKRTLKAVGC